MAGAEIKLIAQRENAVFRIQKDELTYAMRLHRVGYRTHVQLQSELEWMAALAIGGLSLPKPVAAKDDRLCQEIDGVTVDVLSWVDGSPLSESNCQDDQINWPDVYNSIGEEMAKLHDISDNWQWSEKFERPAWNRAGLVGVEPLWGSFWANPGLTKTEQETLLDFKAQAFSALDGLKDQLDYGLIHADIVHENVMKTEKGVSLIDFDDGGFGYRLFDLATLLNRAHRENLLTDCYLAFLQGYKSVRFIDTTPLALFQALRSVTYVGWNIGRISEPGGLERNRRFIDAALYWCGEFNASSE